MTSISGTPRRRRSISASSKSHQRPFRKPLYASPVRCAATKAEFVAKPLNSELMASCMACPPPVRATSMNMPQNTPNAVSRLRVLFLVIVMRISSQESMSILIICLFTYIYSITEYLLQYSGIPFIV